MAGKLFSNKPTDTRTFQQFDPSNAAAHRQILPAWAAIQGMTPDVVGTVAAFAGSEPDQQAVLQRVQQAVTDPMFGLVKAGEPFKFLHNTQKAPNFGARYGQNIEPAGQYVQEMEHSINMQDYPHLRSGEKTFNKPLVIDFGGGYQEASNWKKVLSDNYGGKKGKALSKAIAKDGYDGIVTMTNGRTSEIVDISMFGKGLLSE